MRTRIGRDALATLVTVAVLIPFVGYSIRGSMPFVQDPRGMSGVGIVGIILLAAALGRVTFLDQRIGLAAIGLTVLALGFGVAALVAETNWVLLVPMTAGVALLWLVGVGRDTAALRRPPVARHG